MAQPLLVPQDRVAALDAQAAQIHLQSAQEAERLARERNSVLQLLQKVTWVLERAKCRVCFGNGGRDGIWPPAAAGAGIWDGLSGVVVVVTFLLSPCAPGEGEACVSGEAIPARHRRQELPQDALGTQRGNWEDGGTVPRAAPTPGDEPGAQQALLCSTSSAPQCLLARAGCSRLL